jgi:hypothetical protein
MTTQPDTPFPGFDHPRENWSKLPHALIGQLARIDTVAELKVLLYVLRHTWGYQEYDQAKRITLDEFSHGRKRRDGSRIDAGTGLSPHGVKAGVRAAVAHGFLIRESDGRDAARSSHIYRLSMRPVVAGAEGTQSLPPDSEGGYPTLPPERDAGYPTLPPGGSDFAMRSEKESLDRKNTIPAASGGACVPPVGKSADWEIVGRGAGKPAHGGAERAEPPSAAPPSAGPPSAGHGPWEANCFVRAWLAAHSYAPSDDILALGKALEERLGMRPDWTSKRDVASWLSGLWRVLRVGEGDGRLVLDTALDMRDQGLAIPEPYSLVKMARDAAARSRSHWTVSTPVHWLN